MSLKLGNTNIAGTQVLYSTTGNNTDGAMTQKATTDKLNNCVHKTGNETITGNKEFTGNTYLKKPYLLKENSDLEGGQIIFEAADNDPTNHDIFLDRYRGRIRIYGLNSSGTIHEVFSVDIENNKASASASDAVNTVVTTINKSKSANGYFKFGNGLIIQWGRSSQRTITYPIPFSSDTSFSIVVNNQAGTDGYGRPDSVENLTRTSCMVGSLSGYPVRWIAVGY